MIPNPLLDRMEVISVAGYITDEKMHIARDYLEKNTQEACGIKPEQVFVLLSFVFSSPCNFKPEGISIIIIGGMGMGLDFFVWITERE